MAGHLVVCPYGYIHLYFNLYAIAASLEWLLVSLHNGMAGGRGRQIACAWRTWQGYNLGVLLWSWLTSMFSGLLPKDLFKRKGSLAKSYFKQNYCHACHTRFAVFFPLPSCCISSLLSERWPLWKGSSVFKGGGGKRNSTGTILNLTCYWVLWCSGKKRLILISVKVCCS